MGELLQKRRRDGLVESLPRTDQDSTTNEVRHARGERTEEPAGKSNNRTDHDGRPSPIFVTDPSGNVRCPDFGCTGQLPSMHETARLLLTEVE